MYQQEIGFLLMEIAALCFNKNLKNLNQFQVLECTNHFLSLAHQTIFQVRNQIIEKDLFHQKFIEIDLNEDLFIKYYKEQK